MEISFELEKNKIHFILFLGHVAFFPLESDLNVAFHFFLFLFKNEFAKKQKQNRNRNRTNVPFLVSKKNFCMKTIFFVSLFFILCMAEARAEISFKDITGNWTNELGSTCHFEASEDGAVTGHYDTAVGRVHVEHPLYGRWLQGRKHSDVIIIAFTVMWKDTDAGKPRSGTVWNGLMFSSSGSMVFTTQWLLVTEKEQKDQWKSTLVNKDTFKKKTTG